MVTHQHQRVSDYRFSDRCCVFPTGADRQIAVLVSCIALIFFSGCKVGPDFQRPAAPVLAASFQTDPVSDQEPTVEPCNLQADVWWNYFEDATLQGLLIEASAQNLGVREAYFRIIESRARVGTVRSEWFPQVSSKGDYTYRGISENASQFVSQNQDGGGFSYNTMGIDTSWEIDLFGRIARNVEAANAELFSQEESLHDVRIILLADVATAYTQIRVLQQRLAIARENLSLQQKTLEIVNSRENAGLVGQLDQTEAESNVFATRASIPPIEFELQSTLFRLAVLLGRTPSSDFQLADDFAKLPMVVVENVYPGAPAALLARRPDIRKANFDVMAANARIGVAVADRLPQLTIRGDVSVEARDVAVLYSGGSLVHSVGPGFKWNLLNWGRLKSLVEARRAAHDQALLRYQAAVLKAVQEVESALVEYNRNQVRAKELESLVLVTRKSVEVSKLRYEQNLINFDRVLDAQRSLATAEGNYASARGDVILSLIRTYKALGGGWQNPPDRARMTVPLVPSEISGDTIILPIDSPYRESQPVPPAPSAEQQPQASLDAMQTTPSVAYPIRTPPIADNKQENGTALMIPPPPPDNLPQASGLTMPEPSLELTLPRP
jgi:NodT family efflux transporter outer membrane factor (OMF) lipoprotein